MIQRKQTLFLFLGIVALLLCLFFPVLRIDPSGMGGSALLFNIGQRMADGTLCFSNWPMFALLAIGHLVDHEGIVHVAGWIGLVCGASAIYLAMGEVLNEQFDRTVLPIGEKH